MTKDEVLERFQALADPEVLKQRKEKFGIDSKNAIGITNKNLNELAKEIPKESRLALELFDKKEFNKAGKDLGISYKLQRMVGRKIKSSGKIT